MSEVLDDLNQPIKRLDIPKGSLMAPVAKIPMMNTLKHIWALFGVSSEDIYAGNIC